MFITLSPQGVLHWASNDGAKLKAAREKALAAAASESPARLLLCLATRELETPLPPCAAFWREFGGRYLQAFCHTPTPGTSVAVPSESDLATLAESAPPMRGGEYLRAEVLSALWQALDTLAVSESSTTPGGPQEWLKAQNPAWNLVGRVTFHLAENKKNPVHPFAFLATYTHRLSAQARPQYLPLGNALREYAGAKNKEALLSLLLPCAGRRKKARWPANWLIPSGFFSPRRGSPPKPTGF